MFVANNTGFGDEIGQYGFKVPGGPPLNMLQSTDPTRVVTEILNSPNEVVGAVMR
jgi:hypothetical protein